MSGTLTRLQLVTEICDIVGKSTSASSVSGSSLQTRVQNYLNFAQRRIARAQNFSELLDWKTNAATVASVKRYPLETGTNTLGLTNPKDILSVLIIDSENSRRLEPIGYRSFDRKFPRPENYSEGRPSYYLRYGEYLELFRIPDDVYTVSIRYSKWPTVLSNDSQVSDFTGKDELLIAAGVLETYLALEEYTDAATWMQKFMGLLRDSVLDESEPDWGPVAETFGKNAVPIIGEPWASPEGYVDDPLYGYNS
jgi:hypothetical protein